MRVRVIRSMPTPTCANVMYTGFDVLSALSDGLLSWLRKVHWIAKSG